MALMALGDTQTPVAAFRYLPQVQVDAETPGNTGATGWFLQKTHVDGQIEWVGVQLDQTAMPIMLGWRLWKAGEVSDAEMADMYRRMIKPAADFLVDGGKIALCWNDRTITPPWSPAGAVGRAGRLLPLHHRRRHHRPDGRRRDRARLGRRRLRHPLSGRR